LIGEQTKRTNVGVRSCVEASWVHEEVMSALVEKQAPKHSAEWRPIRISKNALRRSADIRTIG
jgi:hypothetical protein